MSRQRKYFIASSGRQPFLEWVERYDEAIQLLVFSYVGRVANDGAQNNVKNLKGGLFEIKINKGPGYRVYFSYVADGAILLLVGGDKHTQSRDIRLAREYWRQYESDR